MFRSLISKTNSRQATSSVVAAAAASSSSALLISSTRNQSETMKLVQQLRQRTDAPILQCKQALVECGSEDIEKCVEWLKKKGLATADKKISRETSVGVIAVAVARDQCTGASLGASVIQLCCETDFTAQNEKFLTLANDLTLGAEKLITQGAWQALENAEHFTTEFQGVMKPLIASVGENIQVRRVIPLPNINGSNLVGVYAHGSTQYCRTAGSMVSVAFLKAEGISFEKNVSPAQQEFATDVAQTCVANFFLADTPVSKFDMLGYDGEDVSIGTLTKEENLQLCRIFQMSTSDAGAPRDIVQF